MIISFNVWSVFHVYSLLNVSNCISSSVQGLLSGDFWHEEGVIVPGVIVHWCPWLLSLKPLYVQYM